LFSAYLAEVNSGYGPNPNASRQKNKLQTDFVGDAVRFRVGRRKLLWFRVDGQWKLINERHFCGMFLALRAGISGFYCVDSGQSSTGKQWRCAMTQKPRLRVIPIIITLAATLILSVGSFYGCSRTFMAAGQAKLSTFFFWSFFVCAGACVVSLIWLLVTVVINFFRQRTEGQ
jgi:hypothetical protein